MRTMAPSILSHSPSKGGREHARFLSLRTTIIPRRPLPSYSAALGRVLVPLLLLLLPLDALFSTPSVVDAAAASAAEAEAEAEAEKYRYLHYYEGKQYSHPPCVGYVTCASCTRFARSEDEVGSGGRGMGPSLRHREDAFVDNEYFDEDGWPMTAVTPVQRRQRQSSRVYQPNRPSYNDDGRNGGSGGGDSGDNAPVIRPPDLGRTLGPKGCAWCPLNGGSCRPLHSAANSNSSSPSSPQCASATDDDTSRFIKYQSECPLAPESYPPHPPDLLPDWMGYLIDGIDAFGPSNLTLLDLSLPGTHDTMSYDLSLTFSDGGIDDIPAIDEVLHFVTKLRKKHRGNAIVPGEVEEFVRKQAKTQQLTVTQQLDNGVRFLDFRIMMEGDTQEWYSLHALQSKQPAAYYLHEIRRWVDTHPKEIVVIWLSRHGSTSATGQDQYPNVTPIQKQRFWRSFTSIFAGVLIDRRKTRINETSVGDMIARNHRVVPYVSDYVEFTGNLSHRALDGALILNHFPVGVFHEEDTLSDLRTQFRSAEEIRRDLKEREGFFLLGMQTSSPGFQVKAAAELGFSPRYFPGRSSIRKSCASGFNIPGMEDWCPSALLDLSQLTSYYNQLVLDEAINDITAIDEGDHEYDYYHHDRVTVATATKSAFPNAIYLDALDFGGTIRTGTELLDGATEVDQLSDHRSERYAYVGAILLANVERICGGEGGAGGGVRGHGDDYAASMKAYVVKGGGCSDVRLQIRRRLSVYPKKLWNEPKYGRLTDWPQL